MYFKIDGASVDSGWGAVSTFEGSGVLTLQSRHFDIVDGDVEEVKSSFRLTPDEARIFAAAILECAKQAEAV